MSSLEMKITVFDGKKIITHPLLDGVIKEEDGSFYYLQPDKIFKDNKKKSADKLLENYYLLNYE